MIVLDINIATVTKEWTLFWKYLFGRWNSNLSIMENVSHWIISLCGSLKVHCFICAFNSPSSKTCEDFWEDKALKSLSANLKNQCENWVLLSVLLSLHALLSVLHLRYKPKLFDSVMYHSWCQRKAALWLPRSCISMSTTGFQ